MKYFFFLFFFFLFSNESISKYDQDRNFINFILLNNVDQNHLKEFDFHASNTSLENFKLLYMAELAKEIFGELEIPKKKSLISKEAYRDQFQDLKKKSKNKYHFLLNQIYNDIDNFTSSKQYASLNKYNLLQSYRLSKTVRAQLKQVRLLSSVWYYFLNISEDKLNKTLGGTIANTQKRLAKVLSLMNTIDPKYEISLFKKFEPTNAKPTTKGNKKTNLIELIVKEQETLKKDTKLKKAEKGQWKPQDNPSYTSFLESFLNAASQKDIKKSEYIPPKSLPKPSNDW